MLEAGRTPGIPKLPEDKLTKFKMLPDDQGKFFNDEDFTPKFIKIFENVDPSTLGQIDLSGHSYDGNACKWLAENVLVKAKQLRTLVISDMFTSRLKTTVPASLKHLLDACSEHSFLTELRCAHNALGIEAVGSFNVFLSKANALEILDVTNCGMSPEAAVKLASSLS